VVFDKSTNGGSSFEGDVFVDSLRYDVISPNNQPGFASIACDVSSGPRSGYLYVVWADTRNGDQDVFLCASSDGGNSWSEGRRVNDDSVGNGKDQYWPWVAVDDRGVVSVVYNDTRNTPDPTVFETYLAYSWDGGRTFINRLLSSAQSPRATPTGAVRFGDYIGLDSWGKHTVPVWTDERAGGFDMEIYTAEMDTLPFIIFSGITLAVDKGWNMLSLPVGPSHMATVPIFPKATSSAFAYTGSYVIADTLENGPGYWLRFGMPQEIHIFGDTIAVVQTPVTTGWNLIGSVTSAVSCSSITSNPPGMITGSFFDYAGTYTITDSIRPGHGYWVKVDTIGVLILSSTPSLASAAGRIIITPTGELPPPSPDAGMPSAMLRVPAQFSLEQNYPNPFNPSTVVRYSLPAISRVTLKVYDILGREVATIVDATQNAGGHAAEWNASGVSSGLYFYTLRASGVQAGHHDAVSETKKLLVLR
jgi:hypothetical protein